MIVSTAAAAKKLLKINAAKAAKEMKLDPSFGAQNAFVLDTSRYLAAQCSRRAGKTRSLGLRFFRTLAKHPGAQCIYLALTRDSAYNIMWPVLQEINEEYQLGCVFLESKLTMFHPNGSKLRLLGADMKNFIKRLKGIKSPGIAIDEAQDFGTHLQTLVDDVLTPTLTDYKDSWLAMTGTPGPVPTGYFFDVTCNNKYGYSHHSWTLLENPFLPEPHKFISDLKAKRGWDDNNPTLRREWKNEWVLDTNSLWIQYNEKLNDFTELPVANGPYNYILGIDVGYKDADALAVVAWSEKDPNTYLVEEVITHKQGLTPLVKQINTLSDKYDISKMVIDAGGLGKKLAEELRRQHQLPVEDADKTRKQETVEFLNDALRTGKFKARARSVFAQDSYLVQIDWEKSTPNKVVIKRYPHSDIIDAVLYAFKQSPAFSYVKPKDEPKYGTKEWAERQSDRMFELAQEHFEREAELNKRISGEDF